MGTDIAPFTPDQIAVLRASRVLLLAEVRLRDAGAMIDAAIQELRRLDPPPRQIGELLRLHTRLGALRGGIVGERKGLG